MRVAVRQMTSRLTRCKIMILRMTPTVTRKDFVRMISFTGMPDSGPRGGEDGPRMISTPLGEVLFLVNQDLGAKKAIEKKGSLMMCNTGWSCALSRYATILPFWCALRSWLYALLWVAIFTRISTHQ